MKLSDVRAGKSPEDIAPVPLVTDEDKDIREFKDAFIEQVEGINEEIEIHTLNVDDSSIHWEDITEGPHTIGYYIGEADIEVRMQLDKKLMYKTFRAGAQAELTNKDSTMIKEFFND